LNNQKFNSLLGNPLRETAAKAEQDDDGGNEPGAEDQPEENP
jgi:hypothetical protein